jgi:probable rRNA maturation factor
MRRVQITIKNLQKKIPLSLRKVKAVAVKALSRKGGCPSGQLYICFVDDRKIRRLNLKYLGKDSATDVLAFDESLNADTFCADVVISTDTAAAASAIFGTSPSYEVYLYVVHGILHLIGYDDATAGQRKAMERESVRILSSLKITP